MPAGGAEGLQCEEEALRDIVKVDSVSTCRMGIERSCRSEVGDLGMRGVTAISHEVPVWNDPGLQN